MTDLHLPRLDLARAVTDALGRGRYVLTTDGAGRPLEVTLDLKERPDDLFDSEAPTLEGDGLVHLRADQIRGYDKVAPRREDIGKWKRLDDFLTDDHGPAIPAQGGLFRHAEEGPPENGFLTFTGGPSVYEFALQDVGMLDLRLDADEMWLRAAPDQAAVAAADWVHVYDRVTRERRTLKRPEPDAVLTGLRDVAADLRRRNKATGHCTASRSHGKLEAVRDNDRGAPVEPPFGCAPLPPVGPDEV